MANPITLKKSNYIDPYAARWEEFLNFLVCEDYNNLTEKQKIASITNWFNNELLSGGFESYFYNLGKYQHDDVVNALIELEAICQNSVLKKVMEYYNEVRDRIPNDYDEYMIWNEEAGYEKKITEFNLQYYDCRPEIETELLERFLDQNESEFIKWE